MEGEMRKWMRAGVGVVSAAAVPAFAALPDGVDTAITGIQTDGLLLITAVTGVVVAFLAPKVIVKLVKRFTGML